MRFYAAVLIAGLTALALVLLGFWWAPFPAGLALGAIGARGRVTLPAGGAVGLLSWAIPLAAAESRYGLGPAAGALAAIMGFPGKAAVPVALTLLVPALLGLLGAWLGSAARGVLTSART